MSWFGSQIASPADIMFKSGCWGLQKGSCRKESDPIISWNNGKCRWIPSEFISIYLHFWDGAHWVPGCTRLLTSFNYLIHFNSIYSISIIIYTQFSEGFNHWTCVFFLKPKHPPERRSVVMARTSATEALAAWDTGIARWKQRFLGRTGQLFHVFSQVCLPSWNPKANMFLFFIFHPREHQELEKGSFQLQWFWWREDQ